MQVNQNLTATGTLHYKGTGDATPASFLEVNSVSFAK
jgi:hypothetical protein